MDTIQIPRAIYDAMVAHARDGFPNEVCGVVLGANGELREVQRARNTAPDPLYTYDMDERELLRLYQREDEGLTFSIIYHSHPPFAEVYPSATDIAKAFYPDAIYIILAIGQIDARFRERLRDPAQRASVQRELGDPQTMPPRVRAYRIIKDDVFAKEGRVDELHIEIA